MSYLSDLHDLLEKQPKTFETYETSTEGSITENEGINTPYKYINKVDYSLNMLFLEKSISPISAIYPSEGVSKVSKGYSLNNPGADYSILDLNPPNVPIIPGTILTPHPYFRAWVRTYI